MTSAAPWHRVLAAPSPGEHLAQLYGEPEFLARVVGHFAAQGLRRGEAVVIVATPFHWRMIARGLESEGLAVGQLRRRQLIVLDAAESLTEILTDGMPDGARFRALIGSALESAKAAGYQRIRAFGEMVDLLHRTSPDAMVRLEVLWSELVQTHGIALLCAYSLDNFDPQIYRGLLQQICALHSTLVPVEDYERLEQAVTCAYAEVFGPSGDAEALRTTWLRHYARPTAMPDAEAAILAVQEFVPRAAESFLESVRHHYHRGTVTGPGSLAGRSWHRNEG